MATLLLLLAAVVAPECSQALVVNRNVSSRVPKPFYLPEDAAQSNLDRNKGFALIISADGCHSHRGAGVRQMALMLDLMECNLGVDTLSEQEDKMHHDGWQASQWAQSLLADSTHFHTSLNNNIIMTVERAAALMRSHERIFLFGWAWEQEWRNTAEVALEALESDKSLWDKTTLILDDNPITRCYGVHDLTYCRLKAPALLARWLQVASRAFAISETDALNLNKFKIWNKIHGPAFEVWPLRLEQMQRLFREGIRSTDVSSGLWMGHSQKYITMVANDHSENRMFIGDLVQSGAFTKICDRIAELVADGRTTDSAPVLLFAGSLTQYMERTYPELMTSLASKKCLRLKHEIRLEHLNSRIFPSTRALLNPFTRSLNSGISVKTHQAVATGTPVVTSIHGFRGLESCGQKLQSANLLAPADPDQFTRFFLEHLVEERDARRFVMEQKRIMKICLKDETSSRTHICKK